MRPGRGLFWCLGAAEAAQPNGGVNGMCWDIYISFWELQLVTDKSAHR